MTPKTILAALGIVCAVGSLMFPVILLTVGVIFIGVAVLI